MSLKAFIASADREVQQVSTNILREELHADVECIPVGDLWKGPEKLRDAQLLVLDSRSKELARHLEKAWDISPGLNVLLMMEAEAMGNWLAPFLKLGRADVLTKPVVPSLFLHRVRALAALGPGLDVPTSRVLGVRLLEDLHGVSGRLNAQAIAGFFGLSLRALSPAVKVSSAALHKTPDSEKIQPALRDLKEIVSLLLDVVTTEHQVKAWLYSRNRELGDRAPIDLIKEGRGDIVLNFLRAAVMGLPG